MSAALLRHLDLKHLRQLIEIADRGSIRAAADALAISQPALSRSIRAMEKDVGVKLVERGPRGAKLTPAGARLLKYARIIEANLALAEKELRGLRDATSKESIPFGMSWLIEAVLAAPLVEQLRRDHPGIRLTTVVGDYESLAPQLLSGRIDFFVGPPPMDATAVGIASRPLSEFQAAVVVRAAHPLSNCRKLEVSQLSSADWILPAAGTLPRTTYDNFFLRHGAAAPDPVFEVQPLSPAIRQLILQSDLMTILPLVYARPDIEAGLLRVLPFDDRIVFPIHLTTRQMSDPSPARDHVIAEIHRLLRKLA